jgi:chromosome segregation ATPase
VKTLESKEAEIADLRERLSELLSHNSRLSEDKQILERNVSNLQDTRDYQKEEITKLIEDNKKLVRLVNDNDKTIKSLENERIKQMSRIEELSFDLKNTTGKLMSKEDNLLYTQKLLEEAKASNAKLQFSLKHSEKQNDSLSADNSGLSYGLQNEKRVRMDAEKSNSQLNMLITEREREVNRYISDLEASRQANNRVSEDKFLLESENERLKSHIMTLTEQNQGVNFIKNFILIFSFCLLLI